VRVIITGLLAGIAAAGLSAPANAQQSGQESGGQDLSNPDSAFVDTTEKKAWQAEITPTERGFLIGNPDAGTRLTEFISYTCSHCASFAKESGATMDLVLVSPGKLGVEVRPHIRNWLDLTVSLLVQCGDPSGYKDRHRLFLYSQDEWMTRALQAPRSQQADWARASADARLNAARALDLDDMLANRGMDRPDINACLADDEAAKKLVEDTEANRIDYNITGTPSFALDDKLLADIHSWQSLRPVLAERYDPSASAR